MKLYIAEKPSLGRAIADVLPKPHKREEGCIRVGNGDVVSWCIGHLLEQSEPEAYNAQYKQWRLQDLPIVPEQWQLQPKSKTRKQLTVLRRLVKEADQLVHAGDPDREGQLLVDQVVNFINVSDAKRRSMQRLLINDLNPAAVKKSLSSLRKNSDFTALSISALARSRADWLYGINMTRAYTLQGQKVGFNGLLSVGRVQTPLLGLVVRRDLEIENFKSKPFFEVLAHVKTSQGECFAAKWQPSEACLPYMDEEGRVLSKPLAENVIKRITGQQGEVQSPEQKQKSQLAPLPYNLSALQIDAAKQFGFSAKQVLDICQNLYEKHKLISYPRSDCRFIPTEHFSQVKQVLAAVSSTHPSLASAVAQADTKLKGRAWNDKKVEAHHAIIPTVKKVNPASLNPQEAKVYSLVARQYLAQFYPKWEYVDRKVALVIAGGLFVAKSRETTVQGWKVLFQSSNKKNSQKSPDDTDEEFSSSASLPKVKKGQSLLCEQGELLEKHTQAPKHFTDASLLAAMTGISRFVNDPDIRKILKDTDGLGTEATRAGIMELLFTRNYLTRKGKQIHSTPAGRGLIASLPTSATTPDMTAQWEASLNLIGLGQSQYQQFMQPLVQVLRELIASSQATLPSALSGVSVEKRRSSTFKKRGKGARSAAKSKKRAAGA